MNNNNVVSQSVLFKGLSDKKIEKCITMMKMTIKKYSKNDFLHYAGDRMSYFGIILSGTVKVYMDDIDGEQMIMAVVSVGETFGEALSYLNIDDKPIYICADSDATVLWLKPDILFKKSNDDDIFLLKNNFCAMLSEKMLSMNDRIQVLSKHTLRKKIVTFFTQCQYKYDSNEFYLPFSREKMAIYLGTNRCALSRELKKMKEEKIIDYKMNYFIIMNVLN